MTTPPPAGPPDAAQPATDAIQTLARLVRILRYRKSYVFTALVVSGLLGAFYYFTATPQFEASASLLVTETGSDILSANTSMQSGRDALLPTYEKLFSRDVVLDGAARRLRQQPGPARADLEETPSDEWPTLLRRNLSVSTPRYTSLIDLAYRSPSPAGAEVILAAIVQSYLDFMDQNHRDLSMEIHQMLDENRQSVELELTRKHQELLRVRREAQDLGLSSGSQLTHPLVQRVLKLNEALMEIQKQRLDLEATLSTIQAAIHTGGDMRQYLAAVEPAVGRQLMMSSLGLEPQYVQMLNSAEQRLLAERARMRSIEQHLGPAHPQVTELAESIENLDQYVQQYQRQVRERLDHVHRSELGPMLVRMLQEKLAKTWEEERSLSRQYELAEAEALERNDRMAHLEVVQAELLRLQNLHETLLERIARIDLNDGRNNVRVAVVSEPAAPRQAVAPQLRMIGLMCLVLGLTAGVGIVYVLDLLDDRFRSPEELREQLRAQVLAVVRKLPPAQPGAGSQSLQVHLSPEAVESEAFRTLRTMLAFSDREMNRVAVTSSEPGDGKTTVLSNLGATYAQAGKRTLLIDADLRLPGLSKLFSARRERGLADLLRVDDDLDRMTRLHIRPSGVDGMDLLPCGAKPADPTELLSGPRFEQLLAWAERNYDQVLIDCPPVLAASDAAIVGRLCDGTILVVHPAKNHRRLVTRAVDGLRAMQVTLVGLVANCKGDELQQEYYGYGYGYGYGKGYGREESEERVEATDALPEDDPMRARAA